jgi:hypothetical protein
MTDVLDEDLREPVVVTVAAPSPRRSGSPVVGAATPEGWFLGAALLGAGVIHLVMVPVHWGESAIDGMAFLLAGAVQLALAILVVVRPRRLVWAATVVVSAACLVTWVVSRTAGLPVGSHQGVAEDVGFVDGVCAQLELAAIIVGVVLLVRSRARVAARPSSRGLPIVGSVAVLVLAAVAIASPSARTHGHTHGAGEVAGAHSHGVVTGTADDLGFAELANGQMGAHLHAGGAAVAEPSISPADVGPLSEQLALTAPLVSAYPTLADARAAGYRQAGPFSPGLGIHYNPSTYGSMNVDGVMDAADIANPILIYDGIEDSARLAGFMYMAYQETEPEGFVGDLDRWHYHTSVCIVMGPGGAIDTPFGADLTGVTAEMCEAEGGSLIDFTGYMVHVWTVPGYESSLGVFSDLNPRLTCPDGTYHRVPTAEIGDADTTCLDP